MSDQPTDDATTAAAEPAAYRTGTVTRDAGPYAKGMTVTTDPAPEHARIPQGATGPVWVDAARFENWLGLDLIDEAKPAPPPPPAAEATSGEATTATGTEPSTDATAPPQPPAEGSKRTARATTNSGTKGG
jgi:hypothetical protein